jgi:hypothetical protein
MSGNTQKNTQKNTQQKPQSKKTYTEVAGEYKDAAGEYYNQKYEQWMPWIEDQYLKWFTNDNKASYSTKRSSFPLLNNTTNLPPHPLPCYILNKNNPTHN